MISNNSTNLNLYYHPPNPCLLLLPRSLMLSHPPLPLISVLPAGSWWRDCPADCHAVWLAWNQEQAYVQLFHWYQSRVWDCCLHHLPPTGSWRPHRLQDWRVRGGADGSQFWPTTQAWLGLHFRFKVELELGASTLMNGPLCLWRMLL